VSDVGEEARRADPADPASHPLPVRGLGGLAVVVFTLLGHPLTLTTGTARHKIAGRGGAVGELWASGGSIAGGGQAADVVCAGQRGTEPGDLVVLSGQRTRRRSTARIVRTFETGRIATQLRLVTARATPYRDTTSKRREVHYLQQDIYRADEVVLRIYRSIFALRIRRRRAGAQDSLQCTVGYHSW